jgi:hypothetical protein
MATEPTTLDLQLVMLGRVTQDYDNLQKQIRFMHFLLTIIAAWFLVLCCVMVIRDERSLCKSFEECLKKGVGNMLLSYPTEDGEFHYCPAMAHPTTVPDHLKAAVSNGSEQASIKHHFLEILKADLLHLVHGSVSTSSRVTPDTSVVLPKDFVENVAAGLKVTIEEYLHDEKETLNRNAAKPTSPVEANVSQPNKTNVSQPNKAG